MSGAIDWSDIDGPAKPSGTGVIDWSDVDNSGTDSFGDSFNKFRKMPFADQMTLAGEVIKQNPIVRSVKEAGKGYAEGVTFGGVDLRPKTPQFLPQRTGAEQFARNAGGVAGIATGILGAELASGVARSALVAKYGISAVRSAILQSGLSLGAYEGLKGAAQRKPPLETAGNMATGVGMGMALGGAGQLLGKARRIVGEDIPEAIGANFARAEKADRVSSASTGAELPGNILLNESKLTRNGHDLKSVFNTTQEELAKLNDAAEWEIKQLAERGRTPTPDVPVPPGPVKGLEYNPTTVEPPGPPNESFVFPTGSGTDRYGNQTGSQIMFGNRKATPTPFEEPYSPLTPVSGEFEGYRPTGGATPSIDSDGLTMGQRIRELNRKTPKRPVMGTLKKEPNVPIGDIVSPGVLNAVVNRLSKQHGRYFPDPETMGLLERVQRSDGVLAVDDAFALKRLLDEKVRGGYLKPNNELPIAGQAMEKVANSIRKYMADTFPELAGLLAQEHKYLKVFKALAPQMNKADTRGIWQIGMDSVRNNLLGAKLLKEGLGQPSKVIAPASRVGAKVGVSKLSEEIDERRHKRN